jgi:hypothetical protein
MGKWDSSDEEDQKPKKQPAKKARTVEPEKKQQVAVPTSAATVVPESVSLSYTVEVAEKGVDKIENIDAVNFVTSDSSLVADVDESISSAVQLETMQGNKLQTTANEDAGVPTTTKLEAAPTLPRPHNSIFDGCRSVNCYQRLNFIDQGTYGMVFKARDVETGEVFALKQIKFGPEANKVGFPITALREVNILLALQHPNIIRVKEMVVGSSIDKIYMVMEYCENDLKACMQMSKQSFSTAEVPLPLRLC